MFEHEIYVESEKKKLDKGKFAADILNSIKETWKVHENVNTEKNLSDRVLFQFRFLDF